MPRNGGIPTDADERAPRQRSPLGDAGTPRRRVKAKGAVVTTLAETPEFLHCPGIVGHYRSYDEYARSVKRILLSFFELHNESMNVWTHFVAALVYLTGIAPYMFWMRLRDAPLLDRYTISLYYVAAATCFLLSAVYHLFLTHSVKAYRVLRMADHQGILLLICASYIPAIGIGYRCHWRIAIQFLWVNAAFYMMAVVGLWYAHRHGYVVFRNITFLGYTSWGLLPLAVGLTLQLEHAAWLLRHAFVMWSIYGIGFVLYVTRFPEKVWVGKFDLWFSSHQLFHIATIAASAVWGRSMLRLHDHVSATGLC
jgi:adiponectin receptor